MRYPHQQVFSTGAWWDLEEVPPTEDLHHAARRDNRTKLYRRVYVDEETYLKPQPELYTRVMRVDTVEQRAVLETFAEMLRSVTADGGRKRAAGVKPPWWRDLSHEAAIFSHLDKWKHGHRADPDSGAHPLVHLAWRALAIAYQETCGQMDPAAVSLSLDPPCVYCGGPLVKRKGDAYYGAGDGTGTKFACATCWMKRGELE